MSGKKVTPPSTSELGLTMRLNYNLLPDVHDEAVNEELLEALRQGLQEVSRQRLRAILISFRRQANQENCLTPKDLISTLLENKIKLRSRTTRLLETKYQKKHGLDYEALWKLMVEAQSRTGRDSVRAMYGHRDQQGSSGTNLTSAFSDRQDRDLLDKLHKALQTSDGYDLQEMRAKCQIIDTSQHGLIPKKRFRKLCSEYHLPITGLLLSTLMNRCDDEKNGQISWPEFMSLLERAVSFDMQAVEATQARPKSVASSQKPLTMSNNVNTTHTSNPGTTPANSDSTNAGSVGKDSRALLKKQKSVTFDTHSSVHSLDSGVSLPSGGGAPGAPDTMGDEDMEKEFLQSEYRRISDATPSLPPSIAAPAKSDAPATSQPTAKMDTSLSSSAAQESPASKVELSPRALPSPPTHSPGVPKKQPKTATTTTTTRLQSAKTRSAGSRPSSRANIRSNKKTKVADGGGKATGRRPSLPRNRSKEKIAVAETPLPTTDKQEAAKASNKEDTASLSQSNTSTMSTVTTSGTRSDITGDGDNASSQHGGHSAPEGVAEQGQGQGQGQGQQTPERSPSDSTLQKSASSPSIASTQTSQVSQDSDSHSSSQASDRPLLVHKKPTPDSRSLHSVMSSGGGDEKKRSVGSSLMHSFRSLLKRGKKEEEEELMEMEVDGEEELEEELLVLEDEEREEEGEEEGEDLEAEAQVELDKEGEADEPVKGGEEEEAMKDTGKETTVNEDSEPQVTLEVVVQGRPVTYYRPEEYAKTCFAPDPPNVDIQLDWVYGYRGNDCRGNLFEVSEGAEILYFMSNVAIMYNPTLNTQRHYTKHTADIRSMAVHPDGVTVATGQAKGLDESGVKALIHLWKVDSLETVLVLDGDFESAVTCVAFSPIQDYLLAVDNNSKHTLSVWDFKTGQNLASTLLNTSVVCQASFHSKEADQIISIGREHLVFWELRTGDAGDKTIVQTMTANYENNMKGKYVISMAFRANGDLVTGDSNGTIYVWPAGGNTISHSISHAHEGPVFCLLIQGKTLVSGGRDGLIRGWTLAGKGADAAGKLLIPKPDGGVRTILPMGSTAYVGTTVNSLLNVALQDATFNLTGDEDIKCVTQGHYEEVHCMASLSNGQFLTGSYDGTVSLCSLSDHRPVWRNLVKGTNIHCLDVHQASGMVAMGTKDANQDRSVVILMLGQSLEDPEVNRFKLGKGAARCLKISPDGEMIAVGCQDNLILVLQILNKGNTVEVMGKFTGHSGPITGLDWSQEKVGEEPSFLIQSSSEQLEYLIWNVQKREIIENVEEMRNVVWSSHQCLMGFHVAGIWGKKENGLLISSVDVSHGEGSLVATGGINGLIRFFTHPCGHSEAQFREFHTHPHCEVCVRFAGSAERYLLTAGSKDYTICQWKITEK